MEILKGETPRETAIAWMFVLVQFGLLAAMMFLPAGDAWSVPRWLDRIAGWLELVGAAALIIGMINLGRSLTPLPTPSPLGQLKTGGFFRFVRHPIYSGIMALAVGLGVRSANPLVASAAVALIGWFMLKARWEEEKLKSRYPHYALYASKTPRFVPFWPVR